MFDQWFKQDVEKVLARRDRVVVVDESAHFDLIKKVLPAGVKVFVVKGALEELECKYTIEKQHPHDKVVIVTTTPRNRLTFIRDYCETCGCIEIHKLETYITQKVFDELKLNINLSSEEFIAAVHHSIGKGPEYWEGLCRKGADHLFDIGSDILPFLNDPDGFCARQDKIVIKTFFEKINIWLGRNPIKQPPKTLAQEVADKILRAMLESEPEAKYLEVYKKWMDSKTYEESLKHYCNQVDTAIRVIYEEFWGDDDLIRPFQEYYNQLMSPFLFKWFQYFSDYQENQQGLLIDRIQSAKGKIAIVVGDGISYEISQNVIGKVARDIKVDNQYRCSGIPSITENNMSLLYRDDGIVEAVHGKREAYLKSQVKKSIAFVQLDEISFLHADVDVLICSYKDIDDIAEKLGHKALKFIGTIEDTLAEKIQFLLARGFDEVVVTSDHGFVLTGILDESDKVEVQFQGEINKAERYIRTAEKQSVTSDFIEHKQRYGNFQYLYFTKNMKPFKTPGIYGYAHGGLAPQELIIPFITFSSQISKNQDLQIAVANQSQLNGVVGNYFSIHLKAADGNGELFSQERKVQLLFIDQGDQFNTSDIVTLNAGELIKKEYAFDGHRNIEVIVVDAASKQTLTRVSVVQTIARDLGGL